MSCEAYKWICCSRKKSTHGNIEQLWHQDGPPVEVTSDLLICVNMFCPYSVQQLWWKTVCKRVVIVGLRRWLVKRVFRFYICMNTPSKYNLFGRRHRCFAKNTQSILHAHRDFAIKMPPQKEWLALVNTFTSRCSTFSHLWSADHWIWI